MRYLIPFVAMFSFALLTGCAATTSADSSAEPAKSAASTPSSCATCASGQDCAKCDAKKDKKACATCAAGEECTQCAAGEGACLICAASLDKSSCATCAAGEPCTKCDAKKTKSSCATCAAGEACAKCAAKKANDKATDAAPAAAAEPVATINAKGMGCPLCASSADRRLKKVDGVKWTNIDLGNGVVTVGLDPEKPAPSAESLQTAIRDAGFTAEDVTMPNGEVVQ